MQPTYLKESKGAGDAEVLGLHEQLSRLEREQERARCRAGICAREKTIHTYRISSSWARSNMAKSPQIHKRPEVRMHNGRMQWFSDSTNYR